MLLTLEQIAAIPEGKVYLEYRYPQYSSGYRDASYIRAWHGHPRSKNRARYGKTWRCWSEKPSEGEWMKWEDDAQDENA